MTATDWILIIGALSAMFVAIIGAIGAVILQVRQVHQTVNGRMTEMLQLVRQAGVNEGKLTDATRTVTVVQPTKERLE